MKKTLFLVFESAIVICRTFAPINFNFCKNLVILKKRRNYKITGKVKKKSIFRHKSVIRVFNRTLRQRLHCAKQTAMSLTIESDTYIYEN